MPDSLKENKKPSRKEGSKTMAELQVRLEPCPITLNTHNPFNHVFTELFQLLKQLCNRNMLVLCL